MNAHPEILLVEDNPYDADLVIRALRKRNLAEKVTRANDGQEALDFFFGAGSTDASGSIKVVFLDLKMPKVGGLEVLQKLKSDNRTRCLPVVMLTSSQENCDVQECYRLGANSYIVKPMKFEDFAQIIGDLGTYWVERNHLPDKSSRNFQP